MEPNVLSFLERPAKGVALVVDDTKINRTLLCRVLVQMGYDVLEAENGLVAVEMFAAQTVDIVFMDVMMPELDGFAATRQIKTLAGERFVPVLFVTSLNEVEALVSCIACGGDDILFKPVNQSVLKAKALGFERTRRLHNELAELHKQMQQDERMAQRVFSGMIASSPHALADINFSIKSAAIFSGDVVFTEYSPNGDQHILLGDFTGHGLQAAIASTPVAELFHGLTRRGFSAKQIIRRINKRLHQVLPIHMFMACTMVVISRNTNMLRVFNAGMPDAWLFENGQVSQRFPAESIALGISREINIEFSQVSVNKLQHLLLFSDGVVEAVNEQEHAFGEERLLACLNGGEDLSNLIPAIEQSLAQFCEDVPQADDQSLVHVPITLSNDSPPPKHSEPEVFDLDDWQWQMTLQGRSLAKASPVSLMMPVLEELGIGETNSGLLAAVVSDLFSNALEHGLLELDSSVKQDELGFAHYYQLREQALNELTKAKIHIKLEFTKLPEPGFSVELSHNGKGFEPESLDEPGSGDLSGRGIQLVQALCSSVEYFDEGKRVVAQFRLDDHG